MTRLSLSIPAILVPAALLAAGCDPGHTFHYKNQTDQLLLFK